MRRIDQLKGILDSQEANPEHWELIESTIESRDGHLFLDIDPLQLGFAFDVSGERFLGIYNWKE